MATRRSIAATPASRLACTMSVSKSGTTTTSKSSIAALPRAGVQVERAVHHPARHSVVIKDPDGCACNSLSIETGTHPRSPRLAKRTRSICCRNARGRVWIRVGARYRDPSKASCSNHFQKRRMPGFLRPTALKHRWKIDHARHNREYCRGFDTVFAPRIGQLWRPLAPWCRRERGSWLWNLSGLGDVWAIAPDLLGYGMTEEGDYLSGAPQDGIIEHAAALVEHLGLEHVTIVGSSFGSNIACHLAWRLGSRVDGLILAGCGPALNGPELCRRCTNNHFPTASPQ